MAKSIDHFSFKALRMHPDRIEQITPKIWKLFPKEQKISTYSWALRNGKLKHLRQLYNFDEDDCQKGLERRRESKARTTARNRLKLGKEIRNRLTKASETSELTETNSQSSEAPEVDSVDSVSSTKSIVVSVPSPVQINSNVTVRFVPYQLSTDSMNSTREGLSSPNLSDSTSVPIELCEQSCSTARINASCSTSTSSSAHCMITGLTDPPDFSALINSTITRISSSSPTDLHPGPVEQSTLLKLMFENQQLHSDNTRLAELVFQKTEQIHTLLQILYAGSSH